MTDLLRPALYGAWHGIEPVDPRGPAAASTPTSSDRSARRPTRSAAIATLPPVEVGDLLAIRDTGAYGAVMASNYNRRPIAAEVLVEDGTLASRSAGARPSTTCCSGTCDAHRVRRSRSERQGNAGATPARTPRTGRAARCAPLSFPDYDTPIGQEIRKALAGERDFAPDVMQLLYVANRFEYKPRLDAWLAAGDIVICDRYRASSVAYGEAQGLDAALARRDPAPSAGARRDGAPRHRAGDGRQPQGDGPRSLRARPRRCSRACARATAARRPPAGWVLIERGAAEG